jgi:1-acyl-sn-glycerol-3-phosphate acyltransferase
LHGEPTRLVPPWEPLYDAVGTGMWTYTAAAFRIRLLTAVRTARSTIYAATHRAETDVPLIGGQLFFKGGMWRDRKARIHFTAREDMFDRGFFAGFPPDLSLRARRLLYPIAAGPYLPRVRVNPLPYPSAHVLRVGKALEELPADTELAAVLPDDLLERIAERAHEAGLAPPRVARDALRGEFADLLWTMLPRDRLDSPLLEETWTRRAIGATEQVRNAVELVRSGAPTLFFPEGRPSPEGSLGPLRPGMAMLVRRGKPGALRVLAIAYDPVTCGRTYAYLALGEPFLPADDDVEETVLTALRRALPLTAGQVVASEVVAAAAAGRDRLTTDALDSALAGACDDATGQGRAYEPAWREATGRRARLTDAMRFLVRAGLAHADGRRALVIDTARVLADDRLRRAAREYASAREAPAS